MGRPYRYRSLWTLPQTSRRKRSYGPEKSAPARRFFRRSDPVVARRSQRMRQKREEESPGWYFVPSTRRGSRWKSWQGFDRFDSACGQSRVNAAKRQETSDGRETKTRNQASSLPKANSNDKLKLNLKLWRPTASGVFVPPLWGTRRKDGEDYFKVNEHTFYCTQTSLFWPCYTLLNATLLKCGMIMPVTPRE